MLNAQLDIEVDVAYARVTDDTGINVSGALPTHLAVKRAEMLTRRAPGRTYTTTPAEKPRTIGAIATRRKRAAR